MWWRSLFIVSAVMALVAGFVLVRQERSYKTTPAASAARSDLPMQGHLYAGGAPAVAMPGPAVNTHEETTAFDVSQGNQLYHKFNCVACHAEGGGDIGPPLMDDKWIYGSEPRNVFDTIVQGRPNGMPSFRGKLVPSQLYALVAYVRALGGYVRGDAIPSRDEHMQLGPTQNLDEHGLPVIPGKQEVP